MADVKVVIRTIDQGSKEVVGFGKKLEGVLDVVTKSAAAAAAAGAVFKQAFDLSQEGAQITQLRDSFNLMNESVFKTPDLLKNMSDAVRGTIKETDLMKSLLTLSAGASDQAAQAYAAAAPQLLEIAKASNKLNPALGDTSFLFDSLALGIKRGSPMILDNLGLQIKLGEANENYATQLGKTVEELTAEEKTMALLNATLAAGDNLIQQVGGSVDSQADAWARLTVKTSELLDGLKQWLAEGLNPVISALAGDYSNTVEQTIDSNIEMAKSFDELVMEAQKLDDVGGIMGGLGTVVTGTSGEVREGIISVSKELAVASGSFEDFEAVIGEWSGRSRNHLFSYVRAQGMTIEEFYNLERATAVAADMAIEAASADRVLLQAQNDLIASSQGLSAETLAAADAASSFDQALLQNYGTIQETINADRELAQAFQEMDDAAGEYFTRALDGDLSQQSLNQRIFESAEAAGASATELALLGGALGLYSEEAVEAALKTAIIQVEIDRLAQAYAAGNLTVGQMTAQLNNFIAGLDDVGGQANSAGEAIMSLSEKMRNLPSHHEFVVKITQDGQIPTLPSGPEGKGVAGAAMSGGGLVTGGTPGRDSVWKLLMPGERVLNTAQAQEWNQGSKGGGGATTINAPITVNIQGGGDPNAIANAVQTKLMATIRAKGL